MINLLSKQSSFFQDQDFKYPEIAILLEDISIDSNMGKFYVPILTPTMAGDRIIESSKPVLSTANILNKDDLGLSSYTESNYVELEVPKYIFPFTASGGAEVPVTITYHNITKGSKFVIVFVGGDINNIKVIGVY